MVEGDASSLHRSVSDTRWPRAASAAREGSGEASDRGRAGWDLSREISGSGCRRPSDRRKATPPAALSRVVGGPRAVEEPGHALKSPCSRTGRPCGRPCPSMMPRPGWFAGWQIGVVAGREGNAEAVILDERAQGVGWPRSTAETVQQPRGTGRGGGGGKAASQGDAASETRPGPSAGLGVSVIWIACAGWRVGTSRCGSPRFFIT